MKTLTPDQVRSTFINYFKKNGHTAVPSSSLIPHDDPTLLFTNAGMNQFKNAFLGIEKRDYVRAVSSQKCVRAGGKHNDLDNVGFTARHHTFFEMLGNFSFGDYFKKEAIHFAWELLTKEFGIPKEKLYVTVHHTDEEAADIWHKQEGLPTDRIFKLGDDNFWRMGDIGPCGPSSEIFYDHGPGAGKIADPYKSIVAGEDRFVEIWNLVFMQFDEQEPGKMLPLPAPSVDTGSGLERLTAAIQGKSNNYNTPLFMPLIELAAKKTGLDLERLLKNEASEKIDPILAQQLAALRVLADHTRSGSFLIGDHALPSNEGRGYVLRRIIRRALRYGHKLSPGTSLLPALSELLIQQMGSFYPELVSQKKLILETLKDEENKFLITLDQGSRLLQSEFDKLAKAGQKVLPGPTAFKLYDTFGFPVDLTQLIAQEHNLTVDIKNFEQEVEKAKQLARASWKGQSLGEDEKALTKWAQDIKSAHGPTRFVGYDSLEAKAKVIGHLALSDGNLAVAFDCSPFYAQGGGQASDLGRIQAASGKIFDVLDVIKKNEIILHVVEKNTDLEASTLVTLTVSPLSRALTARNHSATHLLHAALRQVLGNHVTQSGSLVEPQRLRFDFTNPKALTAEQLTAVETLVNEQIWKGLAVTCKNMSYDEAIKNGALAFFQDKYGDEVRVLKMGDFSTELCGGTHVTNTSDIGLFVIVSESSVSSGVRRIEALTSQNAYKYLNYHKLESLSALNSLNRNNGWESALEGNSMPIIAEQIDKFKSRIKELEREVSKGAQSQFSYQDIVSAFETIEKGTSKIALTCYHVPTDSRDVLMRLSDDLKSKVSSAVYLLIGQGDQERPAILGVTKDLAPKIPAGALFKQLTQAFGGKGGGRPDLAQGSLNLTPEQKSKAIQVIADTIPK